MKARGKEGFQQRLEVQGKHPEAEVCVNCRLNQTCASRRHSHRGACIDARPTLEGRERPYFILLRNVAADKTAENISENRDSLSEPSSTSPSYHFVKTRYLQEPN